MGEDLDQKNKKEEDLEQKNDINEDGTIALDINASEQKEKTYVPKKENNLVWNCCSWARDDICDYVFIYLGFLYKCSNVSTSFCSIDYDIC